METDKELYRIFTAAPQWIFELTGFESSGECEMQSVTLKEIERRCDGVLFPKNGQGPLTVVEFQFYNDEEIYLRTADAMIQLQKQHKTRLMQGMILFRDAGLDPKTEPWCRIVSSFYFDELLMGLAERDPAHPLTAVFQPVLESDEETLEQNAGKYYNQISQAELDESTKSALLDVFVNWLEKRFKDMSKLQIEKLLLGELPDLRETQSGKDLIRIGKEEGIAEGEIKGKIKGKIEGMQGALIRVLEKRFGTLPLEIRQRIEQLTSVEKLDDLLLQVFDAKSIDELKW